MKTHFPYCWRQQPHQACYRRWHDRMIAAGWQPVATLPGIFGDTPKEWRHKNGVVIGHAEVEEHWAAGGTPPPF